MSLPLPPTFILYDAVCWRHLSESFLFFFLSCFSLTVCVRVFTVGKNCHFANRYCEMLPKNV